MVVVAGTLIDGRFTIKICGSNEIDVPANRLDSCSGDRRDGVAVGCILVVKSLDNNVAKIVVDDTVSALSRFKIAMVFGKSVELLVLAISLLVMVDGGSCKRSLLSEVGTTMAVVVIISTVLKFEDCVIVGSGRMEEGRIVDDKLVVGRFTARV